MKEFWIPDNVGFKSTVFVEIALSTSKSFVRILIVPEISSLVVRESLFATGASFTAVTEMVINALFEVSPN